MTDPLYDDDHRSNLISEMASLLAEVIEGPANLCLTLTLEHDERRWAQYFDGQVNLACFASEPPHDLIERLGPAVVVAFEPGQYVTVTLAARDAESITAWIYAWFEQALDAGEAFVLDAATEEI